MSLKYEALASMLEVHCMVNSKIQSLCPPPPLWLVMSIPLPIRVNLSPIHVQHPYLPHLPMCPIQIAMSSSVLHLALCQHIHHLHLMHHVTYLVIFKILKPSHRHHLPLSHPNAIRHVNLHQQEDLIQI